MSESDLVCLDDARRRLLRDQLRDANGQPLPNAYTGLDYVEVSDDQRSLTVHFFGAAPAGLTPDNFRVDGGERVRGIRVTAVSAPAHGVDDGGLPTDDSVVLDVSDPGDFSTYTLRIGRWNDQTQTFEDLDRIDPSYGSVAFSFKASCPSALDCKQDQVCPPVARSRPDFTYLAKDYSSFRQLMLDRLATTLPGWQERHVPDEYLSLVELLAYVGDHLSYYQDAVATEAYIGTARQRISIRRHARLVDYAVHEGCNARAWVVLTVTGTLTLAADTFFFVTRLGDSVAPVVQAPQLPAGGAYEAFCPLVPSRGDCGPPGPTPSFTFNEAYNAMRIYTWGREECCLQAGATGVTLLDAWTPTQTEVTVPSRLPGRADGRPPSALRGLSAGDVLVFEEVVGPKTGVAADADPNRRWAVRLTKVSFGEDPLARVAEGAGAGLPTPLVEVEWGVEDALPFSLCMSAVVPPDCRLVTDITLVRGNVVLVDHGRCVGPEPLGSTTPEPPAPECCEEGEPAVAVETAAPFSPRLAQSPVVFREPFRQLRDVASLPPASRCFTQDPRKALPVVRLDATPALGPDGKPIDPDEPVEETLQAKWWPRADLLESGADDFDFVAEVDNDGYAHIRFGDGELGARPLPDLSFAADYRVGGGARGNVAAETIAHLVFKQLVSGAPVQKVRNPLPAAGGVDPEPLEAARSAASGGGPRPIERAITADDYATLAEQDPRVQRAAATFRWTGSWYEAHVAVDPLGTDEPRPRLVDAVEDELQRYRRIGHDLMVEQVEYVPLLVDLHVCVLPDYLRAHVTAAVADALSARALPDGTRGFFHPDNLTPGAPVWASAIVAAVQAVEGVASVSLTRFERQFAPSPDALSTGKLDILPLEVAELDNDPARPERGILTLDVRGGR